MKVLVVALFLSAAAYAAAEAVRASDLLGSPAVDEHGEPLGRVTDLVFDARDGSVSAIVLEYGGWLGLGETTAAVPRQWFRSVEKGLAVLDADAQALRRAPALDAPAWPRMRASALIDREVVDRLHRDVGEVRDLVMEPGLTRVRSAFVDRRDDWLPGRSLVAVPIEWFSLPRDLDDQVTLNYSRERLE